MLSYPAKEVFLSTAREGQYVPFAARLAADVTPRALYGRLRSAGEVSFLLESSRTHPETGRWSVIAVQPFARFQARGRSVRIDRDGGYEMRDADPFEALRELLRERPVLRLDCPLPFVGGSVGLFAYELKNQIEEAVLPVWDPYGIPDMDLGFFDGAVVFDHVSGEAFVCALERVGKDLEASFREGAARIAARLEAVSAAAGRAAAVPAFAHCGPVDLESNRQGFTRGVARVKAAIRAGDVFQTNLSHCLEFDCEGDGFALYLRGAEINPTSFGAFADFGSYAIACGSPERLVRLENGAVTTRPIAGTRPRFSDPAPDAESRRDLFLSPKERAEHIMLVDLERNDLGRVCRYGSVEVNEMMVLESYSHVHHIVSSVRGQLDPEKDAVDLLKSVFPGGTITGAPKVRVMQLIDELEGRARGPYTGSIGFIGFDGNCDLNIVIRSLLIKNGRAYLGVGSGVVADSDAEREYEETLHKAKALLQAVGRSPRVAREVAAHT